MSYHADFDQLILDARMAVGITPFTKPWGHRNGLHHRDAFELEDFGRGVLSISCRVIGVDANWNLFNKLDFILGEDRKIKTLGSIVLDRFVPARGRPSNCNERWSLAWTEAGRIGLLPGIDAVPTALDKLSEDDQRELYAALERPVLDARPRR